MSLFGVFIVAVIIAGILGAVSSYEQRRNERKRPCERADDDPKKQPCNKNRNDDDITE